MTDKKISELASASTPLAGTELVPIVQSGSTVKVAVSEIGKLPGGNTGNIQFNNAGNFAGSDGLTFNTVTNSISAAGYQLSTSSVITETTTQRTLSSTDNGKVIWCTNTASITVLTTSSVGVGFSCTLMQGSTGVITITAGTGTSVVSYGGFVKTAGQYAAMSVFSPVQNSFVVMGQTA